MTTVYSKSPLVWAWAAAALLVCACNGEKEPQAQIPTAEEMAASEKRFSDSIFIARLKPMLIDVETDEPLALKGAVDGTYIIGTADGETYTASQMARVVSKALFGGRETVVADDESGYHYACDLSDGQSLQVEGSTTSKDGVYATVTLDISEFKKLSTLLIKTEAAFNEDNAAAIAPSITITDSWWVCNKCNRIYSEAEAEQTAITVYCKKTGYKSLHDIIYSTHTAAQILNILVIEQGCFAYLSTSFYNRYVAATATPLFPAVNTNYTCLHGYVYDNIIAPRCLYCTNGTNDMWALQFCTRTYQAPRGSIFF
jgi:hypothetical protein